MDLTNIPEPSWHELLLLSGFIGVLFGWLFNYIVSILKFLGRKVFIKESIEGIWESYAPNYPGRGPKYRRYSWKIVKGLKFPLLAIATSTRKNEMIYKGRVFYEQQYVVMELFAKHDQEAVYIRLQKSAPTLDDTMVGISLKHDYRGIASAGPIVFTRQQKSDDEIEELIKSRIKVDRSLRVLQMNQP